MPIIHVIGLGSSNYKELTLGAVELLQSGLPIYLRTVWHPSVSWLEKQGIQFKSFDALYEETNAFEDLYAKIADLLIDEVTQHQEIIYAVPGHPLLAERVSEILLSKSTTDLFEAKVYSSVSALDSITACLGIDPSAGLVIQDALAYKPYAGELPQLVLQVYNRRIASDLKLTLMDSYPDEAVCTVIKAAGLPEQERIEKVFLHELDHLDWFDHLCSVFIEGKSKLTASSYPLDSLVAIMEQLRGVDGCPWDQEQDHLSLRRYCLEEACEVIAAIDKGDTKEIVDELGDLLLQIAFHACIGAEEGEFDISDVIEAICAKMIRRHPHVFSDVKVADSAEVLQNWEQIKLQEKGSESTSLLKGVGSGLPGLMRSAKIQKKSGAFGLPQVPSEESGALLITKMQKFMQFGFVDDPEQSEIEFGDLLFELVNWSRNLEIDPELAIMRSCDKFLRYFLQMEKESARQAKNLNSMTLSEIETLWELIKGQSMS